MTRLPEKNADAIAHRLRIASEDAQTMRTKAKFIGNEGGPHPVFAQAAFHESRVELLEWMLNASSAQINAKRVAIEAELGPAIVLKNASLVELPEPTVVLLAHLALCEYALGIHAHQATGTAG